MFFLVIFVLLLGISSSSAAKIKAEAFPKEINVYSTKTFAVNCTYEPDPSTGNGVYLISLVLSQMSPTGPRLAQELASLDIKAPLHVLDSNKSPYVKFSGQASEKGVSFLGAEWSQYDPDLVGTYVCQANVIDSVGHLLQTTSQVTVVEDSNSLHTFLEELKAARKELDRQQACCINVSAQVAEIQAWRKTVALSLAYLEKMTLMTKGSQVYNNATYFASKNKVDGVETAQAVCQSLGGYLAEIDDANEWKFIQSYLNHDSSVRKIYVAGRDDVIEGHWYWKRNRQTVPFFSWGLSQPNHGYNEDCLEIAKSTTASTTWHYNDVPCKGIVQTDTFLCEVPTD